MNPKGRNDAPIRLTSVVGLTLIATLVATYMVSQTLRNSIGVIAPNLAAELGLSASQLGLLSSAFFISFAAAQVPLGLALDRFGPKLCILVCTAIVIVGTGLFASAETPGALIFARVLIGLGCSCYLMAPLAFYARRFSPDRFSTLAGLQLGLGTLGTLFATAPLAMSTAALGWRMTFWLIAGAMVIGGVLVALVVPADRGFALARGESLRESLAGTLAAIRTPSVTRLFLMQLATYSSFALVVGLWGGPYLTHVYGYGLVERGDLLFLAAAGQVVGLVLNGPIERWLRSHKAPVTLGAALTAALFLVLAVAGSLPPLLLTLWLFAFGLVSAYMPALIAHGKSLFPAALTGRGLTWLNMGSMAGVFLTQFASGVAIDLFPSSPTGAYPLAAYRLVFALQAAFLLAAIVPYLRARDPAHQKNDVVSAT
ncbi:MAG: MFS transporter [Variibacter sp.]|nr:MFS transporter [Variibacter sp.]